MIRRLLLPAVLLTGLVPGASAQTVSARIGGELTGFAGSVIAVPVSVDLSAAGGATLGSYTARVQWDPAVLAMSCSGCGVYSGDFSYPLVNGDSSTQGIVKFSGLSAAGVSGLVTVATFKLSVVQETSSPVDLSFSEMSAAVSFTDLLPSLSVSSATFCGARGRWGDLDSDGRANSRDALAILSYVVGITVDPSFDLTLGDVDGDGKTNTRDALIILSYAVGLDIPGQRVLLAVPTDCGTGSARQLAVLPATTELVPGQYLTMGTRVTDGSGRAVSVRGATWNSSNVDVAGVDQYGNVDGRHAGTAVISAEVSPGVRGTAVVTVVPRRPNWYVSLAGTGDPFQTGSVAHPFEHPYQAFGLLGEGDTVRVAPGVYLFDGDGELRHGAVILGGTPGDTTTRPVFRDPDNQAYGLSLLGGQRTVVRNVVLDNFDGAVNLAGVRTFVLEDSRIRRRAGTYSDGIYACAANLDTLRVERTDLLGDPTDRGGYGVYVEDYYYCGRTGTVILRDSRVRGWETGVYLGSVDSVAVERSEIGDTNDEGLLVYGYNGGEAPPVLAPGAAPVYALDGSVAVYVSQSRFENVGWRPIYVDGGRRLVVDTTVVHMRSPGIQFYAPCCGSSVGQVYLRGDSILFETDGGYSWLGVSGADSLVVDGTVVRFPADTSVGTYSSLYADKVVLTHSKLLNVGAGATPFTVYGSEAFADDVQVTGCAVASCDAGYGLEFYPSNSLMNATVLNSAFSSLSYALTLGQGSGVVRVSGVTIDSVGTGIVATGDSIVVEGNVLTRVSNRGIELSTGTGPVRLSAVTGNSVSCAPGATGSVGLNLYGHVVLVERDTVTACETGLSLQELGSGSVAHLNTVRQATGTGISSYQTNGVSVAIDSNGVSDASVGVQVITGTPLLLGNNIRNSGVYGLYVSAATGLTHQVHGGSFVGNALALYAPSDSVDAEGNWWGDAAGACQAGDCVSGRVNTDNFLVTDPLGSQWLAPPRAWAVAARPPSRVVPVRAQAPRATPAPGRPVPPAPAFRGPHAAAHAAAVERARARRAERDRAHEAEAALRAAAPRPGAP